MTVCICLVLLAVVSPAIAQRAVPFEDHFDKFEGKIWQELPAGATAKDGVLTERGPGAINLISRKAFEYGTYEARVRFNALADSTHYYLGFLKTVPWDSSSAWCMVQGSTLNFRVGNAKAGDNVGHSDVSTGRWYNLKIICSEESIALFLDGKPVGETTNHELSPAGRMRAVAMTLSEDRKQEASMEVDWIKVSNSGAPSSVGERSKAAGDGKAVSLSVENRLFLQEISLGEGAAWAKLQSKPGGVNCLANGYESPMFAVMVDGNAISSMDMKVEDHSITTEGSNSVLRIILSSHNPALSSELTCKWGESEESIWSLKVTNHSGKEIKVKTIFPLLEDVRIGVSQEDNYYFYPFLGGWCGKAAASLITEYPGVNWMQVMCVFNRACGRGLYLYSKDNSASCKGLILNKAPVSEGEKLIREHDIWDSAAYPDYDFDDDHDIVAAIYYPEKTLAAGQSFSPPDVAMGIYQGDWHEPLKTYSVWAHTWYKRQTSTPQWFKDSFNFVSQHPAAYYSEQDKKYVADEKLQGAEDVLQWAFWWDYPLTTNSVSNMDSWPGDYDYNRERGGLSTFKDEVKKVQDKGTRFTLYINERLDWYKTRIGQTRGKDYARMDAPGHYNMDYLKPGEGWNECVYSEGWQDYLAETCGRLVHDTGIDGIYLDEMAFLFPCYNPEHSHYQKGMIYSPELYARLMNEVTRSMRKWNPEAILMGEHAGADYFTQFFDGAWSEQYYRGAYPFAEKVYDDYNINFFRFCFPEFKTAEWGESDPKALKRCFFSGVGICWDGSNQDSLRKMGHVFKENGDAFASTTPEPIIGTMKVDLFANKFPVNSKVIYTLYNKGQSKVDAGLIAVDHRDGYHYVELVRDMEVTGHTSGGKDIKDTIDLPIETQDVACLAQLPGILDVRPGRLKGSLDVVLNAKLLRSMKCNAKDLNLFAFLDEDDSDLLQNKGKRLEIKDNQAGVDVQKLFGKGGKLILKLMQGDKLVDERVLTVSGSNGAPFA